jgi:hypothetical protein
VKNTPTDYMDTMEPRLPLSIAMETAETVTAMHDPSLILRKFAVSEGSSNEENKT